jgi:hypothetical protein
MTRLAPFILRWSALRETPGVKLREDLEDPFFPLIAAFERDGGFHIEKSEINLEYLTLFMRNWRARADDPPMESFDPDALDEVDRAGSMAQFLPALWPAAGRRASRCPSARRPRRSVRRRPERRTPVRRRRSGSAPRSDPTGSCVILGFEANSSGNCGGDISRRSDTHRFPVCPPSTMLLQRCTS